MSYGEKMVHLFGDMLMQPLTVWDIIGVAL